MGSGGEAAVLAVTEQPSSHVDLDSGTLARRRVRFTSNIAGPIFLFADLICLGMSVPLSLFAYRFLFADRLIASVAIFAFSAAAATYLMIRASRHAYNRTIVNLFDHEADSVIDALASVLIASALVWQFGMIENLSRGIAILFLLAFSALLLASRPVVRRAVRHLAGSGSIEQRIVFYGADPVSIGMIRRVIEVMDLPHVKYLGVADDRPKVKSIDGLTMI